ncbi:hypothetical protein J989_1993 [Acinetobacter baumannii 45075_3]|nr:hypothetical protein J523_1289 [Acinetobacter baumannii 1202252]EXB16074.1 hypothetical protein J513_0185 [Acinetobacter baumannii 1397084]EXD44516.1 hypothetical protein J487_0989 [Acinetobacter baumannii 562700]EXE54731.1 hypothetical protein J575_0671 [Acinetobacter baumannii 43926]EXQ88759.1 hypothetical protein J670_0280 [Acinetobacter baumannii 1058283]EXS50875.1 hypothetical protein J691_1599 [Acinetobacter baumannii 981176]EYD31742.1 hypothetical protein J922_0446 [Acinetobacter ba
MFLYKLFQLSNILQQPCQLLLLLKNINLQFIESYFSSLSCN